MGGQAAIRQGDCVEVMRSMDECSVDAIVTDPPYDLVSIVERFGSPTATPAKGGPYERTSRGFMGKTWDGTGIAFRRETWAEALRVLKPGGYLLSFGGTRTFHRMTVAIEDAGFEIRDCLMWLYGSGFPKSHDVSKAIDKAAGAEREVVGQYESPEGTTGWRGQTKRGEGYGLNSIGDGQPRPITAPATDPAKKWQGWGTALKPAWEPIVLARKPLIGTVAQNVETHGTGALNIDGTRIRFSDEADERESKDKNRHADFGTEPGGNAVYGDYSMVPRRNYDPPGRWPANVLLDEAAAAMLDEQSGEASYNKAGTYGVNKIEYSGDHVYGGGRGIAQAGRGVFGYGDRGGASRFFYVAKASKKDRGEGNTHPTVKPTELMRWLVRLVTPPGGLVLDPFAGSGTTAVAAEAEGMRCILIECEPEYVQIMERRLAA